MRRIERKQREAFSRVMAVVDILTFDLLLAHRHLSEAIATWAPKETIDWEMSFTAKTAVRALFAHIEGVSQVMRLTVAEYAAECGLQLSEKERLELEEKRLNSSGELVNRRLKIIGGLKLAAKRFPSLFGTSFDLPVQAPEWQALNALEMVRKEIAQPKTLDHLTARDAIVYWQAALHFYLSTLWDLLRACARTITGVEPSTLDLARAEYKFHPREAPTFSAEDHKTIAAHPLRTLEYVRIGLTELMRDSSRAMALSSRLASHDSLLGKSGQFGLRNLARSVTSELEGTVAITKLFVLSSQARGEIVLTPAEMAAIEAPSALDAVVALSTIWSREFWKGEVVTDHLGPRSRAARGITIRDRLTHPKSAKHLQVTLDEMSLILDTEKWLRNVTQVQFLGEEWVRKASRR